MIRITGGIHRGRQIRVAGGVGTRPSSGRLREALFSMLAPRLAGACVADLFAGSGALGIEAISRGAAFAHFVEIDPRAIAVLRANLAALGIDDSTVRVHRGDGRRWLGKLERGDSGLGRLPEILLLDPPYARDELGRLLPQGRRLLESRSISVFALEHATDALPNPDEPDPRLVVRCRRHGGSAFTLLERIDP